MALSPKLWLNARAYPLTPVGSFIAPLAPPFDLVVLLAAAALLLTLCLLPRRGIFAAAAALLIFLAIQDQSRWQPWFYQYLLMLLALGLAGGAREAKALNTCRLIVAATYFWSGLAKFNPRFAADIFPWMLQPFLSKLPSWTQHGAWAAALVEFSIGAGLMSRRFRRTAVVCAIAMHLFILAALGPLGNNANTVVWPWNFAMIAFLLILFMRRTGDPPAREILSGPGFAFHRVVLLLFAIMPVLSHFGFWDQYLSSSLYSGNRNTGVIYLSDAVFDRMPPDMAAYVTEAGTNRSALDIDDWSYAELNVPAYPEIRIYRNIARQVCRYSTDGSGVELVVREKLELLGGGREFRLGCRGL